MQDATRKPNHKLYGGIAASVALHVIILIALFVRLPIPDQTAAKEETVSVEIVPPPEEQKPEEQKPEEEKPQEQALNLKMPEEKPEEEKQEPAPPPEPPKQEAEEAGAKPPETAASAEEKPPEQEEAKQEEAKEAPPPPPPAPSRQDDAPPPLEAQAKQQEQQAPQPNSAPEQTPQEASSLAGLSNVFQFGEKASDPRKSANGDAAKKRSTIADSSEKDTAANAAARNEATQESAMEAQGSVPESPKGPALSPEITLPGVDLAANGSNAIGTDSVADDEVEIIAALPPANIKPAPRPTPDSGMPSDLHEVKTLFSRNEGMDIQSITAMDNVPREARVAQLCSTELTMQLLHARHFPDVLPSQGASEGTLIDVPEAAFHDGGKWYEVSYRCEIDENATKVVSFALKVGDAIPQNQWRQRGLPAF